MERKAFTLSRVFELAASQVEENSLTGGASVCGNMDDNGNVILPGAYNGLFKDFVANGFMAVGHDTDDLPEGYITSAKMEGNTLVCSATFHSTQAAQDARTVCMERIQAGKSVGLSIQALCAQDGYEYFDSGDALLAWCKGENVDLSALDTKSIKAHKGFCRAVSKFAQIIEFSIVPVPANKLCSASMVASLQTPSEGDVVSNSEPADDGNLLPNTERDFERYLRDAGFSRKQATAITLHGFKAAASQRDADDELPTEPEHATPPAPSVEMTCAQKQLTFRHLAMRENALRSLAAQHLN